MAKAQNQDQAQDRSRAPDDAGQRAASPQTSSPPAAVPAAPNSVGPAGQRSGRNTVKVDVARAAVKQVKVMDTDIALVLADGKIVYVRDGAVQAMIDQDFVIQFADGTEVGGQDLLHSADAADVSRIAITGAAAEGGTGGVVTDLPAAGAPAPQPERRSAKWQNYALIGAPLIGGALAGSLSKGSSAGTTAQTSTGGTQVATKTAMPVISPVGGTNVVNKAQKDAGVTVSGTAEANASVTVLFGSTQKTATADASGRWSVQFAASEVPADAPQVGISATAKTATASTSDPATRDVRVDTTGPAAPTFDAVTGDNVLSPTEQQGTVTVTGTSEAGATVKVQWANTAKSVVADAAGNWTVPFAVGEYPAAAGDYTITAVATDAAGNAGAQASRAVTVNPQVDVAGFVAAGKLLTGNGLVVAIYSGDGKTLIASNIKVASNGTFTATGLSVANGQPIVAVVTDTNETADYLDEATNTGKSLGTTRLLAAGIVTGASITLNVNPLTTIAAIKAGLAEDGSGSVTAAKVSAANLQTAQAMGLGSADITQLTPVVTNGGLFNPKDGISTGEKVGALLAALSGLDQANGGNAQQTIADLTGQISNGVLSAEGQQAVMAGAVRATPQVDPGLQSLVSDVVAQTSAATQFGIAVVAGDNVVSKVEVAGLKVGGTVPAGAAAVVLQFGTRVATAQISGTAWTYSVTADDLAAIGGDGVRVLVAQATLADGTKVTASRPISIFTSAPRTPTLDAIAGDGIINAAEAGKGIVISGTGAAGTTITLGWTTGVAAKTATVAADGTWKIPYLANEIPQAATNRVTVTSTDQFGNVSAPVSSAVQFDNAVPAAPTIDPVNGTNRVGLSAAATGVAINGTGEPGATVSITWGGKYSSSSSVVDAKGRWTATVPGTNLPDNGVQDVRVFQTDAAGNSSPEARVSVTVSATPPPPPTAITSFAVDNYVNLVEAGSAIQVRGRATPGQTVFVKFGDFTAKSAVVPAEGTWSATFLASSPTAGIPADGTYVITAYATDVDGNRSADLTYGTPVVVDTRISKPLITAVADNNVITVAKQQAGVIISGRADTDVTRVDITLTDGTATFTALGRLDGLGGWTANLLPTDILPDGRNWRATVVALDRAGNTSTSEVLPFIVDTTPPAAPGLEAINGTNRVGSDALANGVTLTGTGEVGATVVIEWKLGSTVVLSSASSNTPIVVGPRGTWSYLVDKSQVPTDSSYTISVREIDAAGNPSERTEQAVEVKTGALRAPTELFVASDNYINAAELAGAITVTGKAAASAAGQTVTVTWNNPSGTVGATTASGLVQTSGDWTATFAAGSIASLTNGTFKVYARLSDTFQNRSADAVQTVIVDSVLSAPVLVAPIAGDGVLNVAKQVGGIDVFVANDADFTAVSVSVGGQVRNAGFDATTGRWKAHFDDLIGVVAAADGRVSVSATARDAAGNERTGVATRVTADFTAPDTPVIDAGQAFINAAKLAGVLTYTGTAEKGAAVTVRLTDGAAVFTPDEPVIADATDGTWTARFSANRRPADSGVTKQLSLAVSATDLAGNTSALASQTVTLDTRIAAPSAPTIFDQDNRPVVYINGAMRSAGFTIRGTTEAGNAVTVSVAGSDYQAAVVGTAWTATIPGNAAFADTAAATITVRASDAAGNTATSTRTGIPIDLGTAAPTFTALNGGGFSNAATTTWINASAASSVVLTGKADPGAVVTVTAVDADNNTIVLGTSAAADPSGNWTLTTTALATARNAAYTLTATAVDSVNNAATSIATPGFSLDRLPPPAPEIAVVSGDDNVSTTERNSMVRLIGRVEPGSKSSLVWGSYRVDTLALDAQGNWSVDVPSSSIPSPTAADRIAKVVVTSVDAAGNATISERVVTVSSNAAGLPVIQNFVAGDNIINGAEKLAPLNISGTLGGPATGLVLRLHRVSDGTNTAADKVVDATLTGTNWTGTFTRADLQALADGNYTLTATARLGDQVSVASRDIRVVSTASAPTVTAIAHVVNASGSGPSYVISTPDVNNGFNVIGKAQPGDIVTVRLLSRTGGTEILSASSNPVGTSGDFSVLLRPDALGGLVNGTEYTVETTVQSKEGNISVADTKVVRTDFTAPQIASFTTTTPTGTYGQTTGGKRTEIALIATTNVDVKAGSQLTVTLNTNNTAATSVTLTAASDGKTLVGTYAVAPGDNTSRLAVSAISNVRLTSLIDNQTTLQSLSSVSNLAGNAIGIDGVANLSLQAADLQLVPATITGVSTAAVDSAQPGQAKPASASTSSQALRFRIPGMGGRTFAAGDEIRVVIADGARKGEVVASYKVPSTALANGTWNSDGTLVLSTTKALVPGSYNFAIQVMDPYGNLSPLALSQKWLAVTVDTSGPVVALNGLAAGVDPAPVTFVASAGATALVTAASVTDTLGGEGTAAGAISAVRLQANRLVGSSTELLGINGTLNQWNADGTGLGTTRFTVNNQAWQVTYSAATKTFTFTAVTGTASGAAPMTTTADQARQLLQALRYTDQNGSNARDGARMFTITAVDAASNVSAPARVTLVTDAARPGAAVAGAAIPGRSVAGPIYALDTDGDGFRNNAYVVVFSEAVRVDGVTNLSKWSVGPGATAASGDLGAGATIVALDQVVIDGIAYATQYRITLGTTGANVVPDQALTIAGDGVIGTGGPLDMPGTTVSFMVPAAGMLRQSVDAAATFEPVLAINWQPLTAETARLPWGYVNAAEWASTITTGSIFGVEGGNKVRWYLNGSELTNKSVSLPSRTSLTGADSRGLTLLGGEFGGDGTKIVSFRVEDAGGNLNSPYYDSRKVVVDTRMASITGITLVRDANGNGAVDSGDMVQITFNEPVALSTGALPQAFGVGATVTAVGGYVAATGSYSGGTPIRVASDPYAMTYQVTLGTGGSLTPGQTLSFGGGGADGTRALSDLAGNTSPALGYTTPADLLSRPQAPVIENVTDDNVIDASEGKVAQTVTVRLNSARAGDVVTLYRDGVQIASTTARVDGQANIAFSVDPQQWGGDGEHALTASVKRGGGTEVSSPFRSVYVAIQAPHWSQLYGGKTFWFDPDVLNPVDGATVRDWRASVSAAGPLAMNNASRDMVVSRDAAGHLQIYYMGGSQLATLPISTRPLATEGFAGFSVSKVLGTGGSTMKFQAIYEDGGQWSPIWVTAYSYSNPYAANLTNPENAATTWTTDGGGLGKTSQVSAGSPGLWRTVALTSDGTTFVSQVDELRSRSMSLTAAFAANGQQNNDTRLLAVETVDFQGMIADQIIIQTAITAAVNDEINAYLAVKYQTVGTPVRVLLSGATYDLTVGAPSADFPVPVDNILQLGQTALGTGNDTIVTAGPDYVNAGAGNDRIATNDLRFRVIDGGIGFDTFSLSRNYSNAVSGRTVNLSDYVSNARGISDRFGDEADDKRVNANGYHALHGIERLDFSRAAESQVVRLTFDDIDQLADKAAIGDPNAAAGKGNLYLVLGSNDVLDKSGLGNAPAQRGTWSDADGLVYTQRYSGVIDGEEVALYVRGGVQGVEFSADLGAITRTADKITLGLSAAASLAGGGDGWSVTSAGATINGSTLSSDGRTLTLSGSGLGGAGVLDLHYTWSGLTNSNGDGPTWTHFAIGTDAADTIDLSAYTGGSGYAVYAQGGDDRIIGTVYGDLIVSGGGNDTMTGGIGADMFRISQNDTGQDVITDFKLSEGDIIDLRSLLGNASITATTAPDGAITAISNLKLVAQGNDLVLWVDTGNNSSSSGIATPYGLVLQGLNTGGLGNGADALIGGKSLLDLINQQTVLIG